MILYIILAIVIFYVLNKKESFSIPNHPLVYERHFNNDGKIGWVPYYGKPGRLCNNNIDCPIFQKCEENKCTIPTNVY
jgi:hypothetical protein